VVVHGERLLLSDFLPPAAPEALRAQAAQVSLGRTPGIGMVRVLDRFEVEQRLRPELWRRLSLPERLEAHRPAYRIGPEQVRAALEPVLRAHGATTPLHDLELEVQPLVDTPDPQFRILEISPDPLRHRWNARVALADEPQASPFLVSLPSGESLTAWRAGAVAPVVRSALRVRAGQVTVLRIDDAAFHLYTSVVCLDSGAPGAEIRVRDQVNGKIHRARVTEEGGLQWSGEPNEMR
jgi:hypothetical protein